MQIGDLFQLYAWEEAWIDWVTALKVGILVFQKASENCGLHASAETVEQYTPVGLHALAGLGQCFFFLALD